MKKFLLSASLLLLTAAAALGADFTYWIQPCTNPKAGCIASDPQLAVWALDDWERASGGRLHFVAARERDDAQIRLLWATPEQGLYGETREIRVHGHRGAEIFVHIAAGDTKDALLRDTIVYLTCLHESGHALGLPHTRNFDDIMYSFQFGGDIDQYFGRYRRKLKARGDIRKNSGLSAFDRLMLLRALS